MIEYRNEAQVTENKQVLFVIHIVLIIKIHF